MSGAHSTDRPLAFWLAEPDADGPDPADDTADTDPAPPPVSGRRYAWIAPERAALPPPPRSAVRRVERRTDPCVVPPPGSDRGGDVGARVTVLPPDWARPKGDDTTKGG